MIIYYSCYIASNSSLKQIKGKIDLGIKIPDMDKILKEISKIYKVDKSLISKLNISVR